MTFIKTVFGISLYVLASALPAQTQEQQAVSVNVSKVQEKQLADELRFIGQLEALRLIDIVPRISGIIDKIHVIPGAMVAKDDVLFSLDPDLLQVAVDQAKAALDAAEANMRVADQKLTREQRLFNEKTLAKAALDATKAARDAQKAQFDQAKATLRSATLNLSYAKIRAPFSGRISDIKITEGSFVGPQGPSLTQLIQLDPISVQFGVPERVLADFIEERGNFSDPNNSLSKNDIPKVRMTLQNGKPYAQDGILSFVDNKVDARTGNVTIKATFPNKEGRLLVNGFVDVDLISRQMPDRLIVPQIALQRDQGGTFVMRVDANNEVNKAYVEVGSTYGRDIVVSKGLNKDDVVVISGLQRIRPGSKVTIAADNDAKTDQ